jgi:hypothetical protein
MAQFTPIMEAIVSTFETTIGKEKALRDKNVKDQNKAITKLVDAHVLACDVTKAEYMKGNASTNDAKKEVKALFDKLANAEYISKASAATYQTCFWIAFETGVPFSRDLHNAKTTAKKEATAKADDSAKKAGKVETTTIPEMHKTLSKALAQARILNQLTFAAELLDCIVETYPDFKETVLAK